MDTDFASLVISATALAVSILSLVVAYLVGRAQTSVQERLLALEATRERARLREGRRAKVTGQITKLGGSHRLILRNDGGGSARQLRVRLDGGPVLEHPLVPRGQDEVGELGPGAEAGYLLARTWGSPGVVEVEISWDDDSGEAGLWRSQLSL